MTCPITCVGRVLLTLAVATAVYPFSRPAAEESGVSPGPEIAVDVRDGQLWARFQDVPLEDAIRAIGEKARFRVEVRGELPGTVSISLNGRSIVDGVRWILGDNSWMAKFEAAGRIGRLYVYGRLGNDVDRLARASPPSASIEVDSPGKPREREARQTRLETIKAVARERPEGAVETLASALYDDADPVVRWNAAAALANFPAESASQALTAVLGDHSEDPNVRRMAAWALGKLDDRNAEWALRDAAFDSEPEVRQAAKDALQAQDRPLAKSRWRGPTKGRMK